MRKSEPWYIHVTLFVIIIALTYLLIRVAIIDPSEYVEKENYFKNESRVRMDNIRQAEILYEQKYDHYSGNLDSLIYFISYDSTVLALITGVDTLTGRSSNPFKDLIRTPFVPDSLLRTPKSLQPYIIQLDTAIQIDTVVNRRGRIVSVDTTIIIGTRYYLECPDGYGSIGSTTNEALKNTASWE